MDSGLDTLKPKLYQSALSESFQEELALAQLAWQPGPDDWADFVDMLAISWVDALGRTLLEREIGGIQTALHRRWHVNQRAGLFVVDGPHPQGYEVRDVESEESLVLNVNAHLSQGAVIQGRLIEEAAGVWFPTGQPDLFDSVSVIQRMDLLHQWLESARCELLRAQDSLRRAFLEQEEQRRAFHQYFGADRVVFRSAALGAAGIDAFYQFLITEFQPESLEGDTYLNVYLKSGAGGPTEHRLELDLALASSRSLCVLYDPIDGIHFLPDYSEFTGTLKGDFEHHDVVARYWDDPGVTALAFQSEGALEYLKRHFSVAGDSLDDILIQQKPTPPRRAPSLLPGPGQ